MDTLYTDPEGTLRTVAALCIAADPSGCRIAGIGRQVLNVIDRGLTRESAWAAWELAWAAALLVDGNVADAMTEARYIDERASAPAATGAC
jgi:hypothetical protein